jgi:hypothetical protein
MSDDPNKKAVCLDDLSDWPAGDGKDALIDVTIGLRGQLTRDMARTAANTWHALIARYPKALFWWPKNALDTWNNDCKLGGPDGVIVNCKIHAGQFGYGFVQTDVSTP